VVTPSRALKDDIVRLHRLPEDRVVVVPHGVEPRHLEVYAGKVLPDRPRVLFLGRLHFRKGIVPAALEFTRRRDLDVEFHVAGDGPDRAALERLAADDPRLRILGPLDRAALDELLRTTSIFVMPTFYEGFGLALLEAMASGHACVAYDIAVVREVLGDTGILTPLADTAALWDAVARLLRDRSEAAALARRAHARARQFSWPEAGEAIDRVIKATAAPLGAVARPAVTAPV
jgi:glycosyltransferase involved in cell wall biosynthesis